MLAVANTGSILRSRTCLMGRGLRRFAQAALLGAVALLAAPALAQQVTPVPSSALTVENWMSSGSVTVQSPTSALVGQ